MGQRENFRRIRERHWTLTGGVESGEKEDE